MTPRTVVFQGLFSIAVFATAAADPPSGPPPERAKATISDSKLRLLTPHFKPVWETKTEFVDVGGEKKARNYTVCHWVSEITSRMIQPGDFLVRTVGGKKLDEVDVASLLAKETDVLVISHGKPMDPSYAPVYDPNLPVVYLRPGVVSNAGHAPVAMISAAPVAPVPVAPALAGDAPLPTSPQIAPNAWKINGVFPRHAWASASNGKVTITQFNWHTVQLPKSSTATKTVKTPEGNRVVQEVQHFAIDVWVPREHRFTVDLASCRAVDRGGAVQPLSGLAKSLAAPTAILLAEDGQTTDPSFFSLLNPSAMVLQAPPQPPTPYFSVSCSVPLEPCFASMQGEQVHLVTYAFETVTKEIPYEVEVDGRTQTHKKTVPIVMHKPIHRLEPLGAILGQLATGEKLDAARLKSLLVNETQVLYSPMWYVDPGMLQLLKPGTIVLSPRETGMAPPSNGESPVPQPATAPMPPVATSPPTPAGAA